MKKLIALALPVAVLSLALSACSDDKSDNDDKSEKQGKKESTAAPKPNKYAHMLDALAALESGEQDDDATFTPGADPKQAAAEQNKALGWGKRSEFRYAEVHRDTNRSCIVSDDAHLVVPSEFALEYYLGDGTKCSFDEADAKVIYRFGRLTNDGAVVYRAVKGADVAPKKVRIDIGG